LPDIKVLNVYDRTFNCIAAEKSALPVNFRSELGGFSNGLHAWSGQDMHCDRPDPEQVHNNHQAKHRCHCY